MHKRHAAYYRQWLEQTGADWPTLSSGAERAPHFAGLNNVRAALESCFGAHGNVEVGVKLASAAAPVFLAMSLLGECHRWSERAILALGDALSSGADEMRLQAMLGLALMHMRGNSEATRVALNRSLAIAEEHGDAPDQLQLLSLLYMFYHRAGDFETALRYANSSLSVAEAIATPAALALAHSLVGGALHHVGDHSGARVQLEAALQSGPIYRPTGTIYIDYEHYNYAGVALARTLWLQGYPNQAAEVAHRALKDAASIGHPVALSIVLIRVISLFLWIGDVETAEELLDRFILHVESYSLGPYVAVGGGYKGLLAVRRGDARGGVDSLQGALAELHSARYEVLTATFSVALVQGLAAIGRFAEGLALIDGTIQRAKTKGDALHVPELLRVKGGLLLSMPPPSFDGAETCLMQSIELSRDQGARAWELRAATDLAKLWADQGRTDDAKALLQPVFEQFVEGLDTLDLKNAERLLMALG